MPSIETANVGRAVAARVGTNIREVRTKLGMTQAQLAAPEFSISYISAIERGKIRPSLKALSVLARRLDVPLTFLLEGSPAGAAEARAVGYSPADSGPDQRIDVDLLQAAVLVQQGAYLEAEELLTPIQPERITTDQVYRLYLLRGQIHSSAGEYQEAVVDLRPLSLRVKPLMIASILNVPVISSVQRIISFTIIRLPWKIMRVVMRPLKMVRSQIPFSLWKSIAISLMIISG